MNIQEKMEKYLGKTVSQANNEEIYHALLNIVQEMAAEKERTDSKKKVYYISAEFLIGKLLSNNMINLGIYGEVKDILEKNGKDICDVSVETADMTKPDNRDDNTSGITFEILKDLSASESPGTGSYKSSYLVSYPVGNRIQVYINRESYAYIKRFLAVTAPEMPISGFVNRIIDEHLKKYEHEMSKLYTECITKPL